MSSRELDDGDIKWEDWIIESYLGLDPKTPYQLTANDINTHIGALLTYFEYLKKTIENKEVAYRGKGMFGERVYDWHISSIDALEIAYQILGILILETGAIMPEKLKKILIDTTDTEYDKKWGWDPDFEKTRKKFLKFFRYAIKNHTPEKKWDVENYFLYDKDKK